MTADDPAPATTVAALLARAAAQTPHAAAFMQETAARTWQATTWHAFHARTLALARGLHGAGLRKGDRIALIAPVSLEWELLHHAALALGAVVVGLDAHDLPQRIADMVEQADITAFATTDPRTLAQLQPARLAAARCWIRIGDGVADGPAGLEHLHFADVETAGRKVAIAIDPPRPDELATIVFTSGTTGAPRGIPYRHAQVCMAVEVIAEAFPFIGTGSRLLCWLPLSNLFQRIVNLAGLRRGAVTYLVDDPRRVMQLAAVVAPDIFIGVPRFFEKLHDGVQAQIAAQPPLRQRLIETAWTLGRRASRAQAGGARLPLGWRLAHAAADRLVLRRMRAVMGHRLRCIVTGSAPMPAHLIDAFEGLGWRVLEAYGLSENVVPMAMNRIDDFRLGSVGRPLDVNELVVGTDGSIRVRGPGVFRGYLGCPTDAQPPFDADGFYATGDIGHLDDAGYLHLTGRSGDMIKTSTGRRIAPVAIEAALSSLPDIDQAMLVGHGRKHLVALCTTALAKVTEADRQRLERSLQVQLANTAVRDRPLAAALIERPFSIERGELTSNLKIRRAAVEAAHAALVQALYDLVETQGSAASDGLRLVLASEDRQRPT